MADLDFCERCGNYGEGTCARCITVAEACEVFAATVLGPEGWRDRDVKEMFGPSHETTKRAPQDSAKEMTR